MIKFFAIFAFGLFFIQVKHVDSHGLLLIPPARSSAWREDPARFPTFYGDNQMFCGGVNTQWSQNGGKCGICGDPYSGPKLFEKGGEYYRGYVVRTYSSTQNIDTVVEITANHKGFFEFRLCNVDNIQGGEATQECLDQTVLKDKYGRTQIPVPGGAPSKFLQSLIIPPGFSCNHCVLQWKYNTGNSWGTDRRTGVSCLGCGAQEQFYGCSDIRIIGTQKREWSISPPEDKGLSINKPPIMVKKDQIDTNLEDQTIISKSLLKKLYNELKRMKQVEESFLANKNNEYNNVNTIEDNDQREIRANNDDIQQFLPQEVHDLKEIGQYQDYPSVLTRVLKK